MGTKTTDQNKIYNVYTQFDLPLKTLKLELNALEIKTTAAAFFASIQGICSHSLRTHLDKNDINNIAATIPLFVSNFMRGWSIHRLNN
jgi:hypothetical protein